MASKKIRKIFFWLLVLFFIATAPVIILYARGYRFNFQQGIFIYAGAITIKSNPQKVEVFIDGKPSPRKKTNLINNSYHFDGIRPGEYLLEVKADGFNTWSKKISIHSGISTEFWNITLTKEETVRERYQAPGIDKFYISPDKKMIAYTKKEEENFQVFVMDIESGTSKNVFSSAEYSLSEEKLEIEKENIEWSPESEKLIVPAMKEDIKHYLVVDIETRESISISEPADIETGENTNISEPAEIKSMKNVRWDSIRKDSIFYVSENSLYRINLANLESTKIFDNISGYDISSSDIYYFQVPSGIVYKASLNNINDPSQVTASPPDDMEDQNYRIIVYDDHRIALFNKDRNLYIFNKGEENDYFEKLSESISGVQFSDDGKKLLYWTDFEIMTYFAREWEVQPQRLENEIRYITRFSKKINNVQWSDDYEHIFFTIGNEIKFIELDHRDHRNMMNLVSLDTDFSNVFAHFPEKLIYFTDKDGDSLNLYSIEFPEKTGIFRAN